MSDPIVQANEGQPTTPGGEGGQAPGGQQPGQGQPEAHAPITFELGGRKYTADEGGIKTLTDDYGRLTGELQNRSQILSDPQKFREYGQGKFPDVFKPTAPPTDEEQQIEQAVNLLRSKGQFTTREEVMQAIREEQSMNRLADQFRNERTSLEKDWDGKDGKPKFDFEQVKKHLLDNGFPTLKSAFNDLHGDAIVEWQIASRGKGKPKVPVIATPGGANPVPPSKEERLDLSRPGAVREDFVKFLEHRRQG